MENKKDVGKELPEAKQENLPFTCSAAARAGGPMNIWAFTKPAETAGSAWWQGFGPQKAKEVSLVGNFCNWDKAKYPLKKIDDEVWEGFTDFVFQPFELYKFYVKTAQGEDTYKADPYALHTETRPEQPPAITTWKGTTGRMQNGGTRRKRTPIIPSR